jgi:hypothetical protein
MSQWIGNQAHTELTGNRLGADKESGNQSKQRKGIITMVRMTSIKALAFSAALTLSALSSQADTPDPFVGTWTLDAAKSTCDPPPAPTSHTFTIAEAPGGAFHETIDLVEGDGTKTHMEFTATRDGKYVPVTGSGYADSVSLTQVNSTTFKYALKKDGKRIESGTFRLSKNGKTMHGRLAGSDPQGAWKCLFISSRQ